MKTTFLDVADEVIAESLDITDEVIKEEIEPIIKQRQEMEKKAFEKSYTELKKLELEVK